MKYSQVGTRQQAIQLQSINAIADNLRGMWFHVSKDDVHKLSDKVNLENNDDEFSWFSRSPLGGGHAGGCVVMMYVVAPLGDKRLLDAAHGDALGKEDGRFLKNWWLAVRKSDVDKLMVVDRFSENEIKVKLPPFLQDPEYIAIRQASVALTAPKQPPHKS